MDIEAEALRIVSLPSPKNTRQIVRRVNPWTLKNEGFDASNSFAAEN